MEILSSVSSIIKANSVLFFDMDGTLINTNLANYLSYKQAIEEVIGTKFTIDYKDYGRFNRSLLKDIFPDITEANYEEIIKNKERHYIKYLPETSLNKIVVEILFTYCKSHKTVLVTNCRENRAISTINYHNLSASFSNSFYREITENNFKVNKYENAISQLNISVDSIIVFENEETEIKDALFCGILKENIINIE